MYDIWKSSWLPRSGEKLPSNLSSNVTVGQHKLTPPPTLDTSIAAAQCWLFTHSWELEWWRSGRVHTFVGLRTTHVGLQSTPRSLAHLSGATKCPVSAVYYKEVVLESCLRRGYVPAGETFALGSLFALSGVYSWKRLYEAEPYTTHYITALDASHRPVLKHHTTIFAYYTTHPIQHFTYHAVPFTGFLILTAKWFIRREGKHIVEVDHLSYTVQQIDCKTSVLFFAIGIGIRSQGWLNLQERFIAYETQHC